MATVTDAIDEAAVWHRRGVEAVRAGNAEQAADYFRAAVTMAPMHAIYLTDLAQTERAGGRLDEAAEHLRRAVQAKPGWAPAHYCLAQTLEALGDGIGAIEHYRIAVAAKPHLIDAWQRLAALWAIKQQWDSARAAYQKAVDLSPKSHELHNNLGTVLQQLGRIDEAAVCYKRALAIEPNCAEAWGNLSSVQSQRRQFDEAVESLEKALAAQPCNAELQIRLADGLVKVGEDQRAVSHLAAAIHARPENDLWRLRLDLHCPAVLPSEEAIDEFQAGLLRRLQAYQDRAIKFEPNELAQSACQPPLELIYHGRDDLAIRRQLAQIFERSLPPPAPVAASGKPSVGFFVPKGSEGIFLRGMAGMLRRLDAAQLRVVVIANRPGIDQLRGAIAADHVVYLPVAGQLTDMAETIRAARLHLVYYWEVGTDATSYFLPLLKPAALQATSWGWPVTSGQSTVDYFFSSRLLEVDGAAAHYSERLVCLDHIPNYYWRPESPAPAPDRSRFGLSAQQHVYLCPQNPAKIQPVFDGLAGEILRRDLEGVVSILSARWPALTEAIVRRFEARFPDCRGRLMVLPRMTHGQYLQLLASADVVLDTVGYSGGANSTYDTLWAGAPLVTLPTSLHRGRYSAAALRTIGLDACVAATADDYVAKAVRIAGEPEYRRELSAQIVARRDVLYDNVAAVSEFQAAVLQVIADANRPG